MGKSSEDMRSLTSKENIYQVFLNIALETDKESITVTDLVKSTNVSRSTFYRHFSSIDAVISYKTSEIVEQLFHYFRSQKVRLSAPERFPFLYPTLTFFRNRADFLKLLIKQNKLFVLRKELHRYLQMLHPVDSNKEGHVDADDFYLVVCSNVMVSLLVLWFEAGMVQSPEELANTINNAENITHKVLDKL